LPAIERMRS